MPQTPEKFFVTTPIYYVNARPHIGHAYTTIVADVLARRARAQGIPTYFLTGTDEHGQKIERSAQAAGVPPQQFTDQVSAQFRSLWDRMGLTYDAYIRTTDPAHKRGAQKLFATLYERGFIYLASYTGQYCVSDEAFVDVPAGAPCPDCGRITETLTEENFFFKLSQFQQRLFDLIDSNALLITPDAARNEVLSFIRGGLKDLSISRSSFTWGIPVPEPAASAAAQKHVIYVWLDALANYMTALGYGSENDALWQKFWPADLHLVGKEITRFHCVYWPAFLMAADIATPKAITANGWLLFDNSKMSKSKGNVVRTETILDVFGPLCPQSALETAPGSVGPAQNVVILSEAKDPCISPSSTALLDDPNAPTNSAEATIKGTTSVVPQLYPRQDAALAAEGLLSAQARQTTLKRHQDLFAADVLRYFLLREIPFGQDGSFSFEALVTRYNADLANGYGNLVSRVLKMIEQSSNGVISRPDPTWLCIRLNVPEAIAQALDETFWYTQSLIDLWNPVYMQSRILADIFRLGPAFFAISGVDIYLSHWKPWMLAKSEDELDRKRLEEVLYTAAESIRLITINLNPILPYATAKVWAQLGLDPADLTTNNQQQTVWGLLKPGTKLGPLSPIFPRADKGLAQIMNDMESPKLTQEPIECVTGPNDPPTAKIDSPGAPGLASETSASTAPDAGPRTASLAETNPGTHVAASAAITTERPGTPSHTEAHASGIFAGQPAGGQPADASPQITIDDFAKIELRVAEVVVAERIPKADKLLRLEVDLGYEKRQILSGIAEWYTPEELIGRRIVVIANLAPRKMRGLESHGMLLAASAPAAEGEAGGKPHLATFTGAETLPLGSRLR